MIGVFCEEPVHGPPRCQVVTVLWPLHLRKLQLGSHDLAWCLWKKTDGVGSFWYFFNGFSVFYRVLWIL